MHWSQNRPDTNERHGCTRTRGRSRAPHRGGHGCGHRSGARGHTRCRRRSGWLSHRLGRRRGHRRDINATGRGPCDHRRTGRALSSTRVVSDRLDLCALLPPPLRPAPARKEPEGQVRTAARDFVNDDPLEQVVHAARNSVHDRQSLARRLCEWPAMLPGGRQCAHALPTRRPHVTVRYAPRPHGPHRQAP